MNRRRILLASGAGLLSGWLSRARADKPSAAQTLARFTAVDWQRYAVMTKPPEVDPPWRLRLEAEYQAARAGEAVREDLLRCSGHPSPHVRSFAAQAMGVSGEPEYQERLRSLLANDQSALVRNYAVEALSRLTTAPGDPAVASAIAAARQDASPHVRFSAQQAELRLQRRVPAGAPLRAEWSRKLDPDRLGMARAGSPAPVFTLTADDGRGVRLADYRERHQVVLLFQLADW